ncbi:MAG: NYN domain-containing protein, partial [Bacteroidota bacterium]
MNNTYVEKETDVRIAVNMIRDVIFNNCERSVLISADSDLVPALDFISEINAKHKTIICFPPKRFSFELQQRAKKYIH